MKPTEPADLAALLEGVPDEGVFTRVVGRGHGVTITALSVPRGESIPEHTNPNEAVAFIIEGSASVTVGTETSTVRRGSWVHFPPGTPHALAARDGRFEMLLVVLHAA